MREFLRKIPLFADLPEDDLARLCSSVEEIKIGAAEILFREGMLGDKAYVIQEGELEIVKQTQGREVLLALRKSGEVIGELALLEEAPRMATVRARSDARLLGISKEQLDLLLISSSSAARLMLKAVVGKWRATQAQLQQS